MQLRKIVDQAITVYNESGGKSQLLKELPAEEKALSQAIQTLPDKVGSDNFLKNIVDILILVCRDQHQLTADQFKVELKKLRMVAAYIFSAQKSVFGKAASFFYNTAPENAYKTFIDLIKEYRKTHDDEKSYHMIQSPIKTDVVDVKDEIKKEMGSKIASLEVDLAKAKKSEGHLQLVLTEVEVKLKTAADDIQKQKHKINDLEVALSESKKEQAMTQEKLNAKEAELKLMSAEIEELKSDKLERCIFQYLKMESELKQNYEALLTKSSPSTPKDKVNDREETFSKLNGIFTRLMTTNDGERKVELPNVNLDKRINDTYKFSYPTMSLFIMAQQIGTLAPAPVERAFYQIAKKMVTLLQPDKLNEVPRNVHQDHLAESNKKILAEQAAQSIFDDVRPRQMAARA